jgi:hypothetical protein
MIVRRVDWSSELSNLHLLQTRFGWTIHSSEFPNSVLNGVPLDLFNLYRAVVARGGFRMGNAINWKGEIFTKMANWTADHKMTGVGNALKRHYRRLLWEYERANQRDIAGDQCMLCQGGPEVQESLFIIAFSFCCCLSPPISAFALATLQNAPCGAGSPGSSATSCRHSPGQTGTYPHYERNAPCFLCMHAAIYWREEPAL